MLPCFPSQDCPYCLPPLLSLSKLLHYSFNFLVNKLIGVLQEKRQLLGLASSRNPLGRWGPGVDPASELDLLHGAFLSLVGFILRQVVPVWGLQQPPASAVSSSFRVATPAGENSASPSLLEKSQREVSVVWSGS